MNPSSTCTCGHDGSWHDRDGLCIYIVAPFKVCPCKDFTPTADSTDELEQEMLPGVPGTTFDDLAAHTPKCWERADEGVCTCPDELEDAIRGLPFGPMEQTTGYVPVVNDLLNDVQIEALANFIRRRDEEHVRHLITMIESDGAPTPELERLKRAIRAEFADTPTKREDDHE